VNTDPLTQLAANASVGLNTRPFDPALLPTELAGTDASASGFLDAAALVTGAAAATQPELSHRREFPPVPDLQPDEPLNRKALSILNQLLHQTDFVIEAALRIVAEHGAAVPITYLPELARQAERPGSRLHKLIATVAGNRGRWLLSEIETWRPLLKVKDTGDQIPDNLPEVLWTHGDPAERARWLSAERFHRPDNARAVLEDSWKSLKAKERTEFLALFNTNLSPADADFLDRALNDKSVEVLRTALALQSRCPSPQFIQDRTALIAGHFRIEKRLLGRNRLVAAPFDADPKAGISGGAQASVVSFIGYTPLDLWQQVLGVSVIDLAQYEGEGVSWDPAQAFVDAAGTQNDHQRMALLLTSLPKSWQYQPWYRIEPESVPPDSPLRALLAELVVQAGQSQGLQFEQVVQLAMQWWPSPGPALRVEIFDLLNNNPGTLADLKMALTLFSLGGTDISVLQGIAQTAPDNKRLAALRNVAHLRLLTELDSALTRGING
jgi:hypothetical protein